MPWLPGVGTSAGVSARSSAGSATGGVVGRRQIPSREVAHRGESSVPASVGGMGLAEFRPPPPPAPHSCVPPVARPAWRWFPKRGLHLSSPSLVCPTIRVPPAPHLFFLADERCETWADSVRKPHASAPAAFTPSAPHECRLPARLAVHAPMSRRYFGSGTSVRDKTSAFRLALAAARGKSTPSALGGYAGPSPAPAPGPGGVRSARYALLDDALPPSASPSPHHQAGPGKQRGEFAQRAQLVFLDVARTSEKLGNLAQCVYMPLPPPPRRSVSSHRNAHNRRPSCCICIPEPPPPPLKSPLCELSRNGPFVPGVQCEADIFGVTRDEWNRQWFSGELYLTIEPWKYPN